MMRAGLLFSLAALAVLPAWALPRPDPAMAQTWWAFQPLHESPPPGPADPLAAPTAIDAFLVHRAVGAPPPLSPPADRRTLIRRATFGLTGLPPSAEETEAFFADASPAAFDRLVDRLLASPQYGEHWGRHWLDVVRYADTAGETADYPVPVAWRYRNYVIDAFNKDKPYNEFLREQIAGDILARRGPREQYAERVTATGYLAISRRFGFDSENYHHLTIQDTIDTLGQSVLGLSLGCARCHDHVFDPVSMGDYYALYGIFESTRYAFPGSEQKQRHRALTPLRPPAEARPAWRAFEARTAVLARTLERVGEGAPAAILRSLDDLDGDFEMQAPAAGGSNGVLVPPWVYEGSIAVTTEAQSPFQNLHARGRVGASVPAGPGRYRIAQALHPRRTRDTDGVMHINLDFRVTADGATGPGHHRFWLGAATGTPAVELLLTASEITLRTGDREEHLRMLAPNEWHNLQLTIDAKRGTVSGRIGRPDDVVAFGAKPLAPGWTGVLDHAGLDSGDAPDVSRPAVAWDNLGVQDDAPLAAVSTALPALGALEAAPATATLAEQVRQLAGLDGDFELQDDDTPPATPWGPGPQSVVKIRTASQSPFHNQVAPGRLGVHLPNSGAYNGFGQTLPKPWAAAETPRLFASFDFRCSSVDAGGDGSWRYYLGHGPGSSAAIELFFNGREFFRRSGDSRDSVAPLEVGAWYQVELALDLRARTYAGTISSEAGSTPFTGELASGWDGVIDYTFIDSYGHLPGVKPALDADNFVLRDTPLAAFGAPLALAPGSADDDRRAHLADLRRQQAALAEESVKARAELERLLVDGPFDLAYAMSEGTPVNSRLQLRGEPSKPGAEIPRGFLSILGGGPLPEGTAGSGRLELAEWLVGPARALTARVMVNRLWQYHFGQGLVRTPNDFGARGLRPDHPELLDYLASQFLRSDWSVKAMHRLIMGSAAYRQASARTLASTAPVAGDTIPVSAPSAPDATGGSAGETIAAFARRRLGAEETRDAILLASGTLDPTPGQGHAFPSPISWGFTQHGPFSAVYEHNRRSVYLMTQRIKRHPFLALFDGPDPNASTAERRTTTVPTQALYFLNDPFVHASSEAFAERVLATSGDEAGQIVASYRFALGRNPGPPEQASAAAFLAAYRSELAAAGLDHGPKPALAAFARVLFGSNEFLTVD
jgi:hypothetical protein